MSKHSTARNGSATISRLLALTLAALCQIQGDEARAEAPPRSPEYLGEIRRNEAGQLVSVPRPPPETTKSPAPPPAAEAPLTAPAPTPAPAPAPTRAKTRPPQNSALRPAPQPAGAKLIAESRPALIQVGLARAVRNLAAASSLAKDGDTIEIDAGDYVGDVVVWKQKRLTIRGIGNGRARLVAGGASAEQKGIWVIRDSSITVENLEFTGARVPDRNGAGIRLDSGHLIVRNCVFRDNENGILTAAGDAEVEIENSEFDHNGAGDGRSHNIYIGNIRRLKVVGSYFHHAKVGHLLKSRAAENHILYNRLTDEIGGRASYELEFPNGGIAYVIGNLIQQSAQSENSSIVAMGAEGYKWPKSELYLVNNTIVNDRPQGANFLSIKPGARVTAVNNLLVGKGGPFQGSIDGHFDNNLLVGWEPFALPTRYDYRPRNAASLPRAGVSPGQANGIDLAPTREYVHPAASRPLGVAPRLPGAFQTPEKIN